MPSSMSHRKWLVMTALISLTVTIVIVSLHLRERSEAEDVSVQRGAAPNS